MISETAAAASEKTCEIAKMALEKSIETAKTTGEKIVLEPDLRLVREHTMRSLECINGEGLRDGADAQVEVRNLTDAEKEKIKEETNWSDEIVGHITTMGQYELYKKANLKEAVINGRKCLVRDIDLDYKDTKTGLTNRERMENGRSPINPETGEKVELHHMDQDFEGPFAELLENTEHGGNHQELHPDTENSWRKDPEKCTQYDKQRENHWKNRVAKGA